MKVALSVILYVLLPASVLAQYNTYESITELNGLSDNRVTCFKKDRDGFMWIGTENGLNRYDGHEFVIYRPGQPKHILSYEHINDIEQDARGRMWVATWNGLNVLDPATDSLTVFSPDLDSLRPMKNNISSALIWDTFIDRQQRVWIAPDGRDLCLYDPDNDEFTYFPWQAFVGQHSPQFKSDYKSIQKIVAKSDHELWLGTTFGLYSFDSRTKKFLYHGGDTGVDFVSLLVDASGVYFAQKNLYCLDVRNQASRKINITRQSFIQAKGGSVVLPATQGIWVVDKSNQTGYPFSTDSKNLFSLHHDKASTVYYSDNLLWLGSSGGVRVFNLQADLFPFIEVFPDTLHLDASNVYSILENEEEKLYYISSYSQNSLMVMNTETRRQDVIHSIQGKPIQHCTKIYRDSKKRIWVLSENTVFYKDNTRKQFVVFDQFNTKTRYSFVDMTEDQEGNFWFVALNAGIFLFNPKLNSLRQFTQQTDDLYASRPTGIAADTIHHTIWISDYGFGVFRYDLRKKKFFFYGTDTGNPKLLRSTLVTDVAVDQNGHAWFATSAGGVSKYSAAYDCFTTYTMNDGLPENSLHTIFADASGSIWLTSEKGVTRLDTLGHVVHHYDVSAGLPHHSFSTPISANASGELFVGVKHGFIKFHPDSLQLRTSPFPITFTSIKQGEQVYQGKSKNEFLYHENEFTFTFSALTYQRTKDVVYSTTLQGYDSEWKNIGNSHTARYTNLPAGTYTFSVKAFDYARQQSSNVANFTFTIHPPFWKQPWFVAFIAGAVITALALMIQNLLKKIQTQQIVTGVATALYDQRSLDGISRIVSETCRIKLHFSNCHLVQMSSESEAEHETSWVKFLRTIKQATIVHKMQPYVLPTSGKTVSCLAVPVYAEGKMLAVIYSEHVKRNFFTAWQLRTVKEIAAICSVKMGRYFVEENIRSKVARDLHDDIGSTLSSINIMSQLAIQQDNPSQHLNKIAENSLRMMENMSDIVWSINPRNDSLEQVVFKMKEFAAEILEPKNMDYGFTIPNEILILKLDVEKRKNLFLIFKEAVNNAAKYSEGSNLNISLFVRGNTLVLLVQDNGKGFEPTLATRGNGIKNMEERARAMGGKIIQTSRPGAGAGIQLEVPLT